MTESALIIHMSQELSRVVKLANHPADFIPAQVLRAQTHTRRRFPCGTHRIVTKPTITSKMRADLLSILAR